MKTERNTKLYSQFPSRPGVYLLRNATGKVLYIGKAINLRRRVYQHFAELEKNKSDKQWIRNVKKVDFIESRFEAESLVLEAKLIKQYLPNYNISLKDDKRYLYVGITKEKYPRVKLLRRPEKEKLPLLDWYGPFPSAHALKEILRLLRRVFPYCSCKKRGQKPCFYYHLKLCPAPHLESLKGTSEVTKQHNKNIRNIRLFLNGKINFLIKDLTKQMQKAAKEEKFEQANGLKRQMQMIQNLLGRFKKTADETEPQRGIDAIRKILVRWSGIDPIIIERLEAYDVANLGPNLIVGSMVVFINGEPANHLYRQFKIITAKQDDPAALKQIILRRLTHQEWLYPQVILIDGGKAQVSAAYQALKEKKLAEKIGLLGLVKKKETIVVPLVDKGKIRGWKRLNYSPRNLALKLLQHARDEAHRFAQRYFHKLQRKTAFYHFK